MQLKKIAQSNIIRIGGNILFFGLLLLMLFHPNAKAWMLQQLMAVGLFKAEIKNDMPVVNRASNSISFSYRDDNGNEFSSDNFKGKVVFINFWATWCPPCIAEMPSVNSLYSKMKDNPNVVFILADADQNLKKSTNFMKKNNYDLPVYMPTGPVPGMLFTGSLPTTVIINKKGEIVYSHPGMAN